MAIVEAGLRGFGEKGFAATTTREIAALAKTNVASISYHFGGKEGLRDACAEHIVNVMREATAGAQAGGPPPTDPDAARAQLAGFVEQIALFLLLRREARLIAGFIMREMAEPSSALDTIYDGFFLGVHTRVCALWGLATGREPESAEVKLAIFSVVGQLFYFNLARPLIERRLGWSGIGPAEARAIAEAVQRTLLARLDADRRIRIMMSFVCALPLIAGLFSACPGRDLLAVGYVEGEYVQLAPVTSAELTEVAVRQGDRAAPGQVVARQERTDAEIALAEAEAARGEAEAELANLREGSRPEEIRVIEASLESARVRLHEAERQADRQITLAMGGIVSEANLDQAVAERDMARTEVAQFEAELAVARLPARAGPGRGGREPARGRQGGGAPGGVAAREARSRRPGVGRGGGRLPPHRRDRRADRAGHLDPARRGGEARRLRRRAGLRGAGAGREPRGALRRLPGRPDGDGQLHLRRAGVHPAGHLLGGEPPEARLPRRGAADRRGGAPQAGADRRCRARRVSRRWWRTSSTCAA